MNVNDTRKSRTARSWQSLTGEADIPRCLIRHLLSCRPLQERVEIRSNYRDPVVEITRQAKDAAMLIQYGMIGHCE